jgi:hypothetical protein
LYISHSIGSGKNSVTPDALTVWDVDVAAMSALANGVARESRTRATKTPQFRITVSILILSRLKMKGCTDRGSTRIALRPPVDGFLFTGSAGTAGGIIKKTLTLQP